MLANVKNKVKNLPLANKLTLIYLILLGTLFAVAMLALRISLGIYDEKLYEKSLQELDFFAQQVEDSLNEVETVTYNITVAADIQEQLSALQQETPGTSDYNYQLYRVRTRLLQEVRTHPIVRNIRFIDMYGHDNLVGTEVGSIPEDILQTFLQQLEDSRGAYCLLDPSEEYPYLVGGRVILKHIDSSMKPLGYYLVTCDVAKIIEEQQKSLTTPHEQMLVYGDYGLIYKSSDEFPESVQREGTQGYKIFHEGTERYFLCWLTNTDLGWTFVNAFPYSQIYGQVAAVRIGMTLVFLFMFLLGFLLLRRLSHMVTRPLQELVRSMQVVKNGDFNAALQMLQTETANDETGQLTQEFRVMLESIDTLIRENYEKQLILQDTRYKMLQAQINPHFLYNTLNTVTWMIRAGQNKDAIRVVVELGELLRAALSKEQTSTVAQEVQLARSYITIQEFRYADQASFALTAEGELDRYRMPRMVLQPLIENAILHGIDDALNFRHIEVLAKEEETDILLRVTDDGLGMSEEQLDAVRKGTAKPKGHGIGLSNIQERLKLMYGEFQMEIDSKPGEGTTVTLRLPKQMEDNNG